MVKKVIKIAVCDDDLELRTRLLQQLSTLPMPENCTIVFSDYASGNDLVSAYTKESFDLLFLDMLMEGLNGIQTALSIRQQDKKVLIVFLTSSSDFAVQSYEVDAFDYILKGGDPTKIERVFNKAIKYLKNHEEQSLKIKSGSTLYSIKCDTIEYIEIYSKKLSIKLVNQQTLETYKPIRELEENIKGLTQFFKIHRSIIINLAFITQISQKFVMTLSGEKLPVARGKYTALEKSFLLYSAQKK